MLLLQSRTGDMDFVPCRDLLLMLYFRILSLFVLHAEEIETEHRLSYSRRTVVRWLCSPQTTGFSAPVNACLRFEPISFCLCV